LALSWTGSAGPECGTVPGNMGYPLNSWVSLFTSNFRTKVTRYWVFVSQGLDSALGLVLCSLDSAAKVSRENCFVLLPPLLLSSIPLISSLYISLFLFGGVPESYLERISTLLAERWGLMLSESGLGPKRLCCISYNWSSYWTWNESISSKMFMVQ
jgi:hypothetical protein